MNTSRISLLITWGKGFYGLEGSDDANWRWFRPAETLIEATLATGYPQSSTVQIQGSILRRAYKVTSSGTSIFGALFAAAG